MKILQYYLGCVSR